MNYLKREKSVVDAIFLIALLGVFILSSLFIVLFGARVYKKSAENMGINYSSRTALAYVTQKLRQHDYTGGVEITLIDNCPVLKLNQTYNDELYCTYLYEDEGYLKELTSKDDVGLIKSAGKNILEIQSFRAKKLSDSLYGFEIIDSHGSDISFNVSLYSYTIGGDEANE